MGQPAKPPQTSNVIGGYAGSAGLTNADKVAAYQGMVADVDKKISALKGQPGAEQQIAALEKQKVQILQRGVEVPAGESSGVDPAKYETKLNPEEEQKFQTWKAQYAPKDSGYDYDLRGAFKAGLKPDPKTGHWPDTFKKPNHPTFSNQSQYAKDRPDLAGYWEGDKYIPPTPPNQTPLAKASNENNPAILQRGLQRLFGSEEYQNAFPSVQRSLRARAYDEYVAPFYKRQGKEPPDRRYFVDHIAPDTSRDIFGQKGAKDFWDKYFYGGEAAIAAVTGARGLIQMERNILSGVAAAAMWAQPELTGGKRVPLAEGYKMAKESGPGKFLEKGIRRSDEYLGDNYIDDTQGRVATFIGQQAPSFVFWGLGGGVGKAGELVEGIWARYALNRLNDFSLAFLEKKIQEESNIEGVKSGAGVVIIGGLLDFYGTMSAWLGTRKAAQQVAKSANELVHVSGKPPSGGGPAGPPRGPFPQGPSDLPPTEELPGAPKQPLLPGAGGTTVRGPGGGITAPESSVPGLETKQLRSGVEGAQKPLDYLSKANYEALNAMTQTVSNGKYKSYAMSPDSVRTEVLKKIGYIIGEATNNIGEHSKDFVEHQAKAAINEQTAKSSQFKQVIDVTATRIGADPAKVVANHVTDMEDRKNVWQDVEKLIQGLVPGAASPTEKTVAQAIRRAVKSTVKLEGSANQTLFAWLVRDTLPPEAQRVLKQEMRNFYGDDPERWEKSARLMETHIEQMIKSGHVAPDDLRGVFRSSNFTGQPTKFQDQLKREAKAADEAVRRHVKRYGPGAANIEDPSFNEPVGAQAKPVTRPEEGGMISGASLQDKLAVAKDVVNSVQLKAQREMASGGLTMQTQQELRIAQEKLAGLTREANPGLTEDQKLANAFKASGDKGTGAIDTEIMQKTAMSLFNKPLNQLTPQELGTVSQYAARISKGMKR